MRKRLIASMLAGMMAASGYAYSESINHHGVDMGELVTIQDQMSELDKQLSMDPNNPSLNHALEQLENDLVMKLRKYNKMIAEINKKKEEALNALPAAGKAE